MARKDVIDGTISGDMEDANDNFIELYGIVEPLRSEVVAARKSKPTLEEQIDFIQTQITTLVQGNGSLISDTDQVPGKLEGKLPFGAGIKKVKTIDAGSEALTTSIDVPWLTTFVTPTVKAHGEVTGTVTLDYEDGPVHTLSVVAGASATIGFSNLPALGLQGNPEVVLTVTDTSTITWDAAIKWKDGYIPVLVPGRNRLVFASEDAGATIDGAYAGGGFA